jgi:hypothetical protein
VLFWVPALLAGLLWFPSAAMANSSIYARSQGGDVYPVQSTRVRMESETVQAVVYGPYAEYRVTFRFVNDGSPQAVTLGFPFGYEGAPDWGHRAEPVAAFKAAVNGRNESVRTGKGETTEFGSDLVYLWDTHFASGPTTVSVSYVCGPSYDGPQWFEYWLHTGRWWKGTIGKSVVRFTLTDRVLRSGASIVTTDPSAYNPYLRPPGSSSPSRGVTEWVFTDYEPEMPAAISYDGPTPTHDIMFPLEYRDGQPPMTVLGGGRDDDPRDPVCDGDALTAWVAPASGGIASKTLSVETSETRVREVRILPGKNTRSADFAKWARPALVRLRFSDGSQYVERLPDEPGLQRFAVDARATSMTVDVLKVYPGTEHQEVAISEVDVDSVESPRFLAFGELIARQPGEAGQPPRAKASPTTGHVGTSDWDIPRLLIVGGVGATAFVLVGLVWRRRRRA